MNTKNKRIEKTGKKTDLYVGHQCSRSRNWLSSHLKYIIIQSKEKFTQSSLATELVIYCLVCRDKKEHNIHDIMYHFMSNHYNQFIETDLQPTIPERYNYDCK